MDSTEEAIEYIRQIEKEIVFSLDDSHLELDSSRITSKDINAYCDILLEKISKELHITSSLEEDELKSDNNFSETESAMNNNFLKFKKVDRLPVETESTNPDENFSFRKNNFTSKIDKMTNYRYSFYDNSNKISIYVASSVMIDQLMEVKYGPKSKQLHAEAEKISQATIFGCHPNSIQRFWRGLFLPVFIDEALVYLSKFGLTSVGIFRKSGVKSRINALKKQVEDGENIQLDSLCVYDVADLVKTWLRDLRPHLICKDLIDDFVNSKDTFSLWHLDDSHRYVLFVILKFLSMVSSHSKQNQMTAHNLAICFAPSLCELETEHYILSAQRCLEHCIQNADSLFCVVVNTNTAKLANVLNRHTSTAIINASPQDILKRILYERNIIDPLIVDWAIKNQSTNGDDFEVNLKFNSFLPNKTLQFKRTWAFSESNCLTLEEYADSFYSIWHLKPGEGSTQVIHEVELDLRGFSRRWYETTFSVVHDQQLKELTSTFVFHRKVSQPLVSNV